MAAHVVLCSMVRRRACEELQRNDQDDNAARVCECGFRGTNVDGNAVALVDRVVLRSFPTEGEAVAAMDSIQADIRQHTQFSLYWNGWRHSKGCIKYNGY